MWQFQRLGGDVVVAIVNVFRRITIFPKLLLTFLLAIVPLLVASLQMNRMGSDSVQTEILSSMQTRAHSYISSLEAEMERIIRVQKQYLVDDDVQKLSFYASRLPYYDSMLMQQRVQNKLLVLRDSSLYLSETKAFIREIGKTLLSVTDEEGMTDEEIRALSELARSRLSPLVYWKGSLLINSFYPDPAYSTRPPSYILQSVIDPRKLELFLQQMIGREAEGAILYNEEEQLLLIGNPGDEIRAGAETFIRKPELLDEPKGHERLMLGGQAYYIAFERSELLDTTLFVYVPESQVIGPVAKYRYWLFGLSVMALAIVIFFSYRIYRLIHNPLKTMVLAFRKVEKGDLGIAIHHWNNDEFRYLYGQFNTMVQRLKQSIEEVYQSRIMAQQAELKQLQSQINPHFLYNTYFMVHRMAEMHDVDNVAKATKLMGAYMMYITRNGSEEARLEAEWVHAVAYVDIQQMRFHQRIRVEIGQLYPEWGDISVPRLILQPIVENAYQHGFNNTESGGLMSMYAECARPGTVSIIIEDNGRDLTDAQLGQLQERLLAADDNRLANVTGLVNVHRRIRLKYGEAYGIRAERSERGGLKVELSIPCASGNENNDTEEIRRAKNADHR